VTSRRAAVLAIGFACLYLAVMGFLAGTMVERMRFDAQRSAVLSRLASAERQVRARLMDLEGDARRAVGSVTEDAARSEERSGSLALEPEL
jgi:hypothetical protein